MTQDSLQQALAELEAQYRAKLPEKIASLEKAFQLMRLRWNPALLREMQQSAHRLAGEGGSYGFMELSRVAKEFDRMLGYLIRHDRPPNQEETQTIRESLAHIRQAAEATESPAPAVREPNEPSAAEPAREPAKAIYLALPRNDKKLAGYLLLQWLQLEANWKALQWAWDADTFALLADQLQALLENATTFQFQALREAAQPIEQGIRDIRRESGEPTGFQLANLTQSMQKMAVIAEPLGEYAYPHKMGLGRTPQVRKLRVIDHENHVNSYLLLQREAMEDLWQTLQWNWHSETLLLLQDALATLEKNCADFADASIVASVRDFHEAFQAIAQTGRVPDEAQLNRLNQLMEQNQRVWQALKADHEPTPTLDNGKKLIYVVEDDAYFSQYLDLQLEMAGYSVKVFNRLQGLADAIREKTPAALLVDIVLTEGDLAGPRAMFQIQKGRQRPLPVAFMSARDDLKARLAAARAHGDAYLTKPLDMDVLLKTLECMTRPPMPEPDYLILVVDNRKDSGAVEYAKVLRQANINVKLLTEPSRFLDALGKLQPDLVLLNAHMHSVSGFELATVARQQKANVEIPIIFYGMRFEQTWKLPVDRGVGEAFLGENIPPGQLLANVMAHLKGKQGDCEEENAAVAG